jgi:glycolate oxidase FAD binding subunit
VSVGGRSTAGGGSLRPGGIEPLAAALAHASAAAEPLRIAGRGTKLGWGAVSRLPGRRVQTAALDRTGAIDEGSLSATFEAGVPLAHAHAELAKRGLMLALDPPLGAGDRAGATVGGTFATADTGPLSHRHGSAAEQLLALTVATGDGRLLRAVRGDLAVEVPGPAVQIAGPELIPLQVGAYGTLGVIASVTVRLHRLPIQSATAFGVTGVPDALRAAGAALDRAHGDLDGLDFAWRAGRGGLLARCAGADSDARASAAAELMRRHGLEDVSVRNDDNALWARQRAGQRARTGTIVRVSAPPPALPELLELSDRLGATAVGRVVALTAYLTLEVNRVAPLRAALPSGASAIVLDLPSAAQGAVDPWGPIAPPLLAQMRTLKQQFDPAGVCNPGIFAGGI